MPELPEVETIRSFIEKRVQHKVITAIDVSLPRLIRNTTAENFVSVLTGTTIEGVSRRGKYLFLHCSGPSSVLVHLRMTGSLLYEDQPGAFSGRAVHVVFSLTEGRLLYRDIRTLGCFGWCRRKGRRASRAMTTSAPTLSVRPLRQKDYTVF